MKVLYLISARATGLGGHFFSLRSLVEALQPHLECCVVNMGQVPAVALEDMGVPCNDVLWRSRQLPVAVRRLADIVRSENPRVLHAFDVSSLFFARLMAWRFRKALVHTKCGGPNPAGYYPIVPHCVLFSVENQQFFGASPRFRGTCFHLIPNRVREVRQDPARIAHLREELKPRSVVFLRIARVSSLYAPSSLEILKLVKRLRQDGVPACFVQIGVVNDQVSLDRIRGDLEGPDRLLTQSEFTHRASEVIDAGDFVVGTGRGFMEAAARGRVLLAPLADAPHPVLVTRDNWDHLFARNFSCRAAIPEYDSEANYAAIRHAISCPDRRAGLSAFSRELFEKHFSMEAAVPQYIDLYRSLVPSGERHPLDLALHGLRVVRHGW